MIDEEKLIEELEDWKNESPDTEEESIWNNAINQCIREVKRQPKVGEWIYFTSREADDEEKEMFDFDMVINCKFPENEEEILVLYSDGYVCIDTFMIDGEIVYLDSNSELETQVIAWMPKPTKDGYRMEGM